MKKMFYHMCAIEMAFVDSTGGSAVTRTNALISTDTANITMADLTKAQQGAQVALFNKIGEQVTVLDLTILSINSLGHMTEEEFLAGAAPVKTEASQLTDAMSRG